MLKSCYIAVQVSVLYDRADYSELLGFITDRTQQILTYSTEARIYLSLSEFVSGTRPEAFLQGQSAIAAHIFHPPEYFRC